MRKWLWVAGLAGVMLWLSGCIIIDTEKAESLSSLRSETAESEEVTIQEIDAVVKLSVENHRRDNYRHIAHRHGLSTGAQVHLVEAVFGNLSRDDAKVDVLVALVHNRCFHSEAKAAILKHLDELSREDSRRKVLDAMGKK